MSRCCERHSLHHLLFHRPHPVRQTIALAVWALLLAGISAGLASMLWDPLGPFVLLAALSAEGWLLLRLTRRG